MDSQVAAHAPQRVQIPGLIISLFSLPNDIFSLSSSVRLRRITLFSSSSNFFLHSGQQKYWFLPPDSETYSDDSETSFLHIGSIGIWIPPVNWLK
jgi:hypothetical protein